MNDLSIGIDLGGTKLLMLTDHDGERRTARVPTGVNFDGRRLDAAIGEFIADLGAVPRAVGIAIPGLVGPQGEVVACDVLPLLPGLTPSQLTSLHCPVSFVNDVEAALVEESAQRPDASTLVVILVGTGIGMAVREAGRVLRGARGWAGELGSIPITPSGVAGSKDVQVSTLDAAASGAAILAKSGDDIHALARRLKDGESAALEVVREAGRALGLGLATVVNLFNPDHVCIGGGTLGLMGYLDAALETAKRHALPELWAACRIAPPTSGDQVAALGALRCAATGGR